MGEQRLVIVSNRGPAQFERSETGERIVSRGGGGLVTALTGLVANRGALWIASAMTEEDAEVERESGGEPEHPPHVLFVRSTCLRMSIDIP